DRVPEPVEEHDVVRRDLDAAAPVDLSGQELPDLGHTLRVAVSPGLLLVDEVGDDVADPFGRHLPLVDRVADVLPRDLLTQGFDLVGRGDDLADLVLQVRSTYVQDVTTHGSRPSGVPRCV